MENIPNRPTSSPIAESTKYIASTKRQAPAMKRIKPARNARRLEKAARTSAAARSGERVPTSQMLSANVAHAIAPTSRLNASNDQ